MKSLEKRLKKDLSKLNIDYKSFSLVLKGYSKTYWGHYSPISKTITLFVYVTKTKYRRSYDHILASLIHEVVHHLQYCDPSFTRYKGVMHNEDFWQRYESLMNKAHELKIVREEVY
jgi:NADPH-dependent 7-cyano-7-deazaguanine reductase QueF-like protein